MQVEIIDRVTEEFVQATLVSIDNGIIYYINNSTNFLESADLKFVLVRQPKPAKVLH